MTKNKEEQKQIFNFPVSVYVLTKHGKPAIELRTLTTDPLAIKIIVERAFNKMPINVFPVFRDELKAVSCLVHKKIMKYNSEKDTYSFIL